MPEGRVGGICWLRNVTARLCIACGGRLRGARAMITWIQGWGWQRAGYACKRWRSGRAIILLTDGPLLPVCRACVVWIGVSAVQAGSEAGGRSGKELSTSDLPRARGDVDG
jgi:hypothetical protein